jgi:hypothetical protein
VLSENVPAKFKGEDEGETYEGRVYDVLDLAWEKLHCRPAAAACKHLAPNDDAT